MVNCRAVEIVASAGSSIIEAGVFSYKTVGFVTTSGSDTVYVVDYCRPYTDIRDDFGFDYEEDKLMQSLQAIAITIPIIGGLALLANCALTCVGSPNPHLFKLMGLFYITTAILQGVGLKMMDSYICTNNPIVQYMDAEVSAVGALFQSDCVKSLGMRRFAGVIG